MKKYLYSILTLCWVALIFSFSLQPADASSQVSSGLLRTLLETFLPGLLEKLSTAQLEMLEFLVRKCAHFTEFAILGALSALTVAQMRLRRGRLCAIAFCVLVACADEMIQLCSDGRAARLVDVLLDSAGALVGIWVAFWMRRQRREGAG